jgi:hypothetical protein
VYSLLSCDVLRVVTLIFCARLQETPIYEKVINSNFLMLTFRRRVVGDTTNMLEEIKHRCRGLILTNCDDQIVWALNKTGFSVKYMHSKIRCDLVKVPFRFLWKIKPPKNFKNSLVDCQR